MNRPTLILLTLLAFLAPLAQATTAHAAPGDLDPLFGTGGTVTTNFGVSVDVARALVMQQDGKVVVGGSTAQASADLGLTRYNGDGSLDTTFDGDGKVTMPIGAGEDVVNALAVQADGRIVAAGYSVSGLYTNFAFARFNADGSPDSSFGTNGRLTLSVATEDDQARALAIQPDGKIIAGGFASNGTDYEFAIARLNPDGSPDATFGTNGIVTTPIGTLNEQIYAIALQPDGGIVAAGYSQNVSSTPDFAFARYDGAGNLDAGFDGDGLRTVAVGPETDTANSVALQPDGKIVAAGSVDDGSESSDDFALVRLNANGSPDTGFGGDGVVITPMATKSDAAHALAVQWNGKIVAAGECENNTDADFCMARYNVDGSPDTDFHGDGMVITAFSPGRDETAFAVGLQADGNILAAGSASNGINDDFALARYLGDPPPPTSIWTPDPDPPIPTATITSPRRSKTSARNLKSFNGAAGPAGQVAKVEIGLLRVDHKLRRRGYCRWLRNNRSVFRKVRDKTRKCAKPRFLKATGRESWSYRLKRVPAKGRYELFVRVTLTNGARHESFSAAAGNRMRFLLR